MDHFLLALINSENSFKKSGTLFLVLSSIRLPLSSKIFPLNLLTKNSASLVGFKICNFLKITLCLK